MTASAWPPVTPAVRPVPATAVIASGAAVLLAGAPVTAVVQGASWPGYAIAVVSAVVGVGLLLRRRPALVVAAVQAVAVAGLLTAVFTSDDVLPGPTALREFGGLLVGAGQQIEVGIAPIAPTPEILFLVTAAFGLVAVAVHLTAVTARAPAAAGVPLLAVFAVPAALADDLLPWWAVAAAAAGFGLLLVAHGGHRFLDGAALVAAAVVLALGIGAGSGVVGTAGRFDSGSGGGGAGGSIGLSPFTALRGQLDQTAPVELFRVRGLQRPVYLRALTLRDYIPEAGWQASRPGPGTELPGPVPRGPGDPTDPTGERVDVQIENVAFRDYWLPLYGEPVEVAGLTESRWTHDPASGTAYSARARQEAGWQQRALLPAPSVGELRAAAGPPGVDRQYLNTTGVDERVAEITREVVVDRATAFDRAMALQDHFTGAGSPFRYSLQTEPGSGDDALVEFLTTGRAGYCEQFASAMAVMLRTIGIPARVAVGFTAGTVTGEVRSIGTGDAHAWVEAWFPGIGWTTFDPTPLSDGRAITPTYVLEARGEAEGQVGADAAPADELTAEDRRRRRRPPSPRPRNRPARIPSRRRRSRTVARCSGPSSSCWCWPASHSSRPGCEHGNGGDVSPRWEPPARRLPQQAGRSCWRSPPTVGCPAHPARPCAEPPAAWSASIDSTARRRTPCGGWSGRWSRAGTADSPPPRILTSRSASFGPESPRAARSRYASGSCPDQYCPDRWCPARRWRARPMVTDATPPPPGPDFRGAAGRAELLLFEAAAEALFHAAGEAVLVGLGVLRRLRGGRAGAHRGDREDGAAEHHEEAQDADHGEAGGQPERGDGDADDEQHQAEDEQDDTLDAALAGGLPQPTAANGRRELGVLGVESALDLFEQSLLVLGEGHGFTSGTGHPVGSSSMVPERRDERPMGGRPVQRIRVARPGD